MEKVTKEVWDFLFFAIADREWATQLYEG